VIEVATCFMAFIYVANQAGNIKVFVSIGISKSHMICRQAHHQTGNVASAGNKCL
jgi:hypothetical protein